MLYKRIDTNDKYFITDMYDFIEDEGLFFIILEYCEGDSLK